MRMLLVAVALTLSACAPTLGALGDDNNSGCVSFTGFGGSGSITRAGLGNAQFECSPGGGYKALPGGGNTGGGDIVIIPAPKIPQVFKQVPPPPVLLAPANP